MAQFLRPSSDITTTNWVGAYTAIDEVTASDSDYIRSLTKTVATYETKLSTATDPLSSTGHIVRCRVSGVESANQPNNPGTNLGVFLFQGAGDTLIATIRASSPTDVWEDVVYTLTSTEANNITDYSDLRIRAITTSINRKGAAISWAEMEIPDIPNAQITGASTLTFSETVTAKAKGIQTGASDVTFSDTVTAKAKGIQTGASDVTFSDTVTVIGKGNVLTGEAGICEEQLVQDSYFDFDVNVGFAQSFLFTGLQPSYIEFQLYKLGLPIYDLKVEIWSLDGSDNLLSILQTSSTTIGASSLTASYEWVRFNFDNTIYSQKIAISITRTNITTNDALNNIRIGRTGDEYPNGIFYYNQGSWGKLALTDSTFRLGCLRTPFVFSTVCAIINGTVTTGTARLSLNADNSYYFKKSEFSRIETTTDLNGINNISAVVRARFIESSDNCLIGLRNNSTNLWFRKDGNNDLSVQLSYGGLVTEHDSAGTWNWDLDWHNFAFSYDGTFIAAFVDGVEVFTKMDGDFTGFGVSNMLQIGRRGTNTESMSGYISDVRVWNRALTPTEQTNVGGDINFDIPSGLIADYREQKGATWIDNVSAQVGTPTLTSFGGAKLKAKGSISGTAGLTFSETNTVIGKGYVSTSENPYYFNDGSYWSDNRFTTDIDVNGIGNHSFLFKIKTADVSAFTNQIIGIDVSYLTVDINTLGLLTVALGDGAMNYYDFNGFTFQDYTEYVIIFTYDASSGDGILYINGVAEPTENETPLFTGWTSERFLQFFRTGVNNFRFNGNFYALQFYDDILNQSEVTSLQTNLDAVTGNKIADFQNAKYSDKWLDKENGYIATGAGETDLRGTSSDITFSEVCAIADSVGGGIITGSTSLTFAPTCAIIGKGNVQNGTEIYVQTNAASIDTEVNATTGWTGVGSSIASVDSGDTQPHHGLYSLKITTTQAGGDNRAEYKPSLTKGRVYKISFWTKVPVGISQNLAGWTNVEETVFLFLTTDTVWTYHELFLTATETAIANWKWYSSGLVTDGTGDILYVDKVSLIEYVESISFGTVCAIADAAGGVITGTSSLTFSESNTVIGRGIQTCASDLTFSESNTVIGKGNIASKNFGDENVLNGTFDTDLTNWNQAGGRGTYSVDTNRLKIVNDLASNNPFVSQQLTLTIGKDYNLKVDVEIGTAPNTLIRIDGVALVDNYVSSDSTLDIDFIADATNTTLFLFLFENGNTGNQCFFDNASIKEIFHSIKFSTVCAIADAVGGIITGTSTLTFSETISSRGIGIQTGSATLTFSETITVIGTTQLSGTSPLTFSETLTLTSKGSIVGQSDLLFTESGTLLARGTLSADSDITFTEALNLKAKGSFSGASTLTFSEVAAITDIGDYSISGTSSLTFSESVTAKGNTSVSGSSDITFSESITFIGRAIRTASSLLTFVSSSLIKGQALFTTSSTLTFTSSSTRQAKAYISASSDITFTDSVTITGAGSGIRQGITTLTFSETTTATGLASISGASSLTFSEVVVSTGKTNLLGVSDLTFTESSTLKGKAYLATTSTIIFSQVCAIIDVGDYSMSGSTTLTFSNVVTIEGKADFGGASFPTFTSQAIIGGRSASVSSSSITFTEVASIRAQAEFGGTTFPSFVASADIKGAGTVIASTQITFTETLGLIFYDANQLVLDSATLTFTSITTIIGDEQFVLQPCHYSLSYTAEEIFELEYKLAEIKELTYETDEIIILKNKVCKR